MPAGFFIIKLSLREGFEYCNLVPFNDNIKLKQKTIGKVLVIKVYVLQSKVAEIAQFGSNFSVDPDVVVPEARNAVGSSLARKALHFPTRSLIHFEDFH